jgi:hypothetical protein
MTQETTATSEADQELARSGGQVPPEPPATGSGGGEFTPDAFGPDAPEDAPAPKAEKPPEEPPKADAKPEEEPAKEEEEVEVEDKPKWDKDRQVKDQELATLRKENAELKARAKPENPPGTEDAPEADDDESDDGKTEAELRAQIVPIDDSMDYDERTKALEKNQDLLLKIDEARALRDDYRRGRAAYSRILRECDEEFGPEFHNKVVKQMADLWKKEGFGPKKPVPDAAHTRLAVRGFYAQAKGKKLEATIEAGKPKPKPKGEAEDKPKTPVQESGNAGAFGYDDGTPEEGPASVDQIFDRMMKAGQVPFARRK